MQPVINVTKKATNITLSSDVLTEAKALGINISQSCDQSYADLRDRRCKMPAGNTQAGRQSV